MSESRFYADEAVLFRDRHPAGDGWQVHELRASDLIGLNHLPAFLKANAQVPVKRLEIIRNIQRYWGRNGVTLPEWDKIREWDWFGDIELVWQEQPVHVRTIQLITDTGSVRQGMFVAAQSMTALDGLTRAMREFRMAGMKRDNAIKVINGRDIPRPNVSWEDLFLSNGMVEDIRTATETFFQSRTRYLQFGLAYRRGFLFCGPPGCGKTMTAKVIASKMADISCVSYSPKEGFKEAELLEEAFATAAELAPSILILEDLDKFGRSIPISLILNTLDGLETRSGILVIATTNEPERLDPALLLRPSRFDRVWSFSLPDENQRRGFLMRKAKEAFSACAVAQAARLSQGFSMAYVQEILASAVAYAVRDAREVGDDDLLRSVELLRLQIRSSQAALPRVGQMKEKVGFNGGTLD